MKALTVWLRISVVCLIFSVMGVGPAYSQSFAGPSIGLTGSTSVGGDHTIDLEVFGYSVNLADSDMKGSSLGLSLDYLFVFGDWRVGPRLRLERGRLKAADRIGNKYVSFDTYLELKEMHSLNLLVGYVATPRLMPYVTAGIAASYGTIGAQLNVLQYSVADTARGWVAGPNIGVGFLYRLSQHSEIGLEYSAAKFSKTYDKCVKGYPLCASLPLSIAPQSLNLTFNYRF